MGVGSKDDPWYYSVVHYGDVIKTRWLIRESERSGTLAIRRIRAPRTGWRYPLDSA
jgi:hypothetical protein